MLDKIEIVKPEDIEKRSFEIITDILGDTVFPALHESVIKRVIHTTADFEFAKLLNISEGAIENGIKAIKEGGNIVTDTMMAASGINKKELGKYGGRIVCYMNDEVIAKKAKARNTTRACLCMEKASADKNNRIFVIGNAPTALIRLYELINEGTISPDLVVGVPVGFVNVVESKELFKTLDVPYIITDGRKGGSNIAAAIINAMLYMNRV
ncbi:precorrin-8X methylmutase [Pseudobacteroides cellulosolvens]|uniref:Precorrin-8X methylmutase CbiC/CobH n=1 Tax=Pseudobacteroides cellulosolvens ATCC 35603 = DSM 2933 TaxID=398512 RepID=A0A0L6JQE8_9FIRM|nr:precorrin-8X methylmutase [Pseudobacteroides cellulosolvens]KNY28014.1 Precorrin-8X methylmutase CbiC/CobH [Pseudobacteroides cellulosolvens ATCC 35603 = DSM 2933]